MASHSGHSYNDIHSSGASRNHLGDVYHQHGPSPDQQALNAVLDSLRYDGMDDRRDRLNSAERGTFEWALAERDESDEQRDREQHDDDLWSRSKTIDKTFTDWLVADEEDNGLFCFMGKPGSGKSTLMKYLATNPQANHFLDLWAAGKSLVRAEHFFWVLGDPVQKSCEGLLRHVLYSTLRSSLTDDMDFAKFVCGSRRLSSHDQRPWYYEELYDMLARLVSRPGANFFFLVDALDECDPQDSHGQIADEILKISQLPNVKLCVSCRPWKPFTSKLGCHNRTLYLDRMTFQDMRSYIRNRLENADKESDLCLEFGFVGKTKRATDFVNNLAIDAKGVFLWTELVVKALGSELRKGCDFQQLQKTRADFPIGLDDYFEKLILDRITRTRQNNSDMAAALMLALKIKRDRYCQFLLPAHNSFLNFWLLASGHLAAGFAWTDHNGDYYTPQDIERMVRSTINFLQEACKDLLVFVKYGEMTSWDIEFLHRTVYDFLCDTPVRRLIEQQSPKHFNDAIFLPELGRLRCVHLLHMTWNSCEPVLGVFHMIVRSRIASLPHDVAWFLKCEALMIHIHQRMQEAGDCDHYDHAASDLAGFTKAGLANYVLAILTSWPHIAMSSLMTTSTEKSVLAALLGEWLRSMFAEPHVKIPSNTTVNATVTPCPLTPSVSNGLADRRYFSFAALRHSLAYTMRDQRTKLLEHLLGWGLDVNARSCEHFDSGASSDNCDRSIWQNWLRAAVLEVRSWDRGISNNERSDGFRTTLENAKASIRDIVAVLLRYGADPDCAICIYDHRERGPCRQVSLESALETITPQDGLGQIRDLRTMQSVRFDRRAIQHRQMRRAMQSLTASKHKASTEVGDGFPGWDFIGGFIQNMIGVWCNDCPKCTTVETVAMALCLDCLSGYQLCAVCTRRFSTDNPTLDRLTEHLVHESSASDGVHASIYIGSHSNHNNSRKREYGEERSISVLEDWYARNMNGEDNALD